MKKIETHKHLIQLIIIMLFTYTKRTLSKYVRHTHTISSRISILTSHTNKDTIRDEFCKLLPEERKFTKSDIKYLIDNDKLSLFDTMTWIDTTTNPLIKEECKNAVLNLDILDKKYDDRLVITNSNLRTNVLITTSLFGMHYAIPCIINADFGNTLLYLGTYFAIRSCHFLISNLSAQVDKEEIDKKRKLLIEVIGHDIPKQISISTQIMNLKMVRERYFNSMCFSSAVSYCVVWWPNNIVHYYPNDIFSIYFLSLATSAWLIKRYVVQVYRDYKVYKQLKCEPVDFWCSIVLWEKIKNI